MLRYCGFKQINKHRKKDRILLIQNILYLQKRIKMSCIAPCRELVMLIACRMIQNRGVFGEGVHPNYPSPPPDTPRFCIIRQAISITNSRQGPLRILSALFGILNALFYTLFHFKIITLLKVFYNFTKFLHSFI